MAVNIEEIASYIRRNSATAVEPLLPIDLRPFFG